ncbi:hypothetical protein B7486_13465 [cyanobacterium TDX16]|nr:hypothetical protein B7486_13465 [cyanobacterium TDX16]
MTPADPPVRSAKGSEVKIGRRNMTQDSYGSLARQPGERPSLSKIVETVVAHLKSTEVHLRKRLEDGRLPALIMAGLNNQTALSGTGLPVEETGSPLNEFLSARANPVEYFEVWSRLFPPYGDTTDSILAHLRIKWPEISCEDVRAGIDEAQKCGQIFATTMKLESWRREDKVYRPVVALSDSPQDNGSNPAHRRKKVPKGIEIRGKASSLCDLIKNQEINDTGRSLAEMLREACVSSETFSKSKHFREARLDWERLKASRATNCNRSREFVDLGNATKQQMKCASCQEEFVGYRCEVCGENPVRCDDCHRELKHCNIGEKT